MDGLADFWVHDCTVQRLRGTSGYGKPVYEPAETVAGFVSDKRRQVRDPGGDTVISETTIALPASVPIIPLGSLVTLPAVFGGRTATVLASSIGDTGGLLADVEHAEYAIT
ncbi:hypothetical protein IEE94_11185 [Yimella sp. cx-573]|nr:hypothetical protein [Yimella sp. cx-573]